MIEFIRKTKPFIIVLILSFVLLNTSCNKEDQDDQPELPPITSMLMYFTDFQTVPGGVVKDVQVKVADFTYNNFLYAREHLIFWTNVTTETMIIPVIAYIHALQQEPQYLGNNTWEWSYTFFVEDEEFLATLTGMRLDNERFSMEMNLAYASVPLVKMKFFDGICRYDHTIASWNIYEFDLASTKILEVDWTKDFETGDASLHYNYVKPGQEETNHKITWTYDPDGAYDAGYYIDLQDTDTYIEWNTTSKAGRVKVEATEGGFDWRCWNELLQDISCPVK